MENIPFNSPAPLCEFCHHVVIVRGRDGSNLPLLRATSDETQTLWQYCIPARACFSCAWPGLQVLAIPSRALARLTSGTQGDIGDKTGRIATCAGLFESVRACLQA